MARPARLAPVKAAVTATPIQWVAFVQVGTRPDGTPDRRKASKAMCPTCRVAPDRSCACYLACEAKVRELEAAAAAGRVVKAGIRPTVLTYLTDWRTEGAEAGRWKYKTLVDYELVTRLYIAPHIGGIRIDALTRDNVAHMIAEVRRTVSDYAAARAYRVLRSAFNDAVRAELVHRSVVLLVREPRPKGKEIQPLTEAEAGAVLLASARRHEREPVKGERRSGHARWVAAFGMGLRQGEALALAWSRPDQPRLPGDVDLDAGTMTVREKLVRKTWLHGCADPAACASQRCRKTACAPPWLHGCADPAGCFTSGWRCPQRQAGKCRRHVRPCPAPCKPGCTGHASTCPTRRDGGLVMEEPKSRKGHRTVGLPDPVLAALRAQRAWQDGQRDRLGDVWVETGLVFTTPWGTPLDPRADNREWLAILAEAGVAHARLHDARHTAATFLLALRVDKRVVMDIMGWASPSMADNYQHATAALLAEASSRMGGLLDRLVAPQPGPAPVPDGSATEVATVADFAAYQQRRKAV